MISPSLTPNEKLDPVVDCTKLYKSETGPIKNNAMKIKSAR